MGEIKPKENDKHTHTNPVVQPEPMDPALSRCIVYQWNFQLTQVSKFSFPFKPAWTRFQSLAVWSPHQYKVIIPHLLNEKSGIQRGQTA